MDAEMLVMNIVFPQLCSLSLSLCISLRLLLLLLLSLSLSLYLSVNLILTLNCFPATLQIFWTHMFIRHAERWRAMRMFMPECQCCCFVLVGCVRGWYMNQNRSNLIG